MEHSSEHQHHSGAVRHWPIIVLGAAVAAVFIVVLVTFQVDETEYAAVYTFGSAEKAKTDQEPAPVKIYKPGLHLKWPYPIDRVRRHDNRWQCYELRRGQYEQNQTADGYQVIVKTYVLWKVARPGVFFDAVATTQKAEEELDSVVRNSRNTIVGQYKLNELINAESGKVKLDRLETQILKDARSVAKEEYGIRIKEIGFKHIGFPEKVSRAVFNRMRAERQRKSDEYIAQGESEASTIRSDADEKAKQIISQAEAKATTIRGKADRQAAEYYRVFRQHPELARFLRKLDALRETLKRRTTLVVNTKTPPYDLLEPGATDLSETVPARPVNGETS